MFQEVKVDFRSLQTQFQDDITELGMLLKPSPEHTVPGIRSKLHLQALAVWCNTETYFTGHNIQGISKAALGYNQAVKENRNLYNMLQEVRGISIVQCCHGCYCFDDF